MSYGVGSDMNYADMILDSVGVANLDEVNLSYMIVSVVIFQKFTWLLGSDTKYTIVLKIKWKARGLSSHHC